MKQLYHTTGHQTCDLTECKLHRITGDGGVERFIVSYPKTWTALPQQTLPAVNGENVVMTPYLIDEWEEVELSRVAK